MPIEAKLLHAAAALLLLGSPLLGGAQTSRATLNTYISQSLSEADGLDSATIAQWSIRHPGEIVEAPGDKGRDYDPRNALRPNAREQQDRKLEGRWCLRSTAEVDIAGGVRVRRIALFYQLLVELTYEKPLPPLPTETGDALRKHGCRLVRILHEFEGVSDPRNFAETIAHSWDHSSALGLSALEETDVSVSKADCCKNSTFACRRRGPLVPDTVDRALGVSAS
jgi:hypothetical protein